MNKTYQELCDENLQLREQLEAAEASAQCARLTSRQALAKAEALEQERDTLAVSEYVMRDLAQILLCIDQCDECQQDGAFDRAAVKARIADTPAASMARLKAQWQAEALESASEDVVPQLDRMANWLRARAAELRGQAEGGETLEQELEVLRARLGTAASA